MSFYIINSKCVHSESTGLMRIVFRHICNNIRSFQWLCVVLIEHGNVKTSWVVTRNPFGATKDHLKTPCVKQVCEPLLVRLHGMTLFDLHKTNTF